MDITGRRFSRFLVLGYSHKNKNRKLYWHLLCDCGKKVIVQGCNLKRGKTKSCGCLRKELLTKRNITHGMKHSSVYQVWANMKSRCLNKNYRDYMSYGGRGIKICDRWLNSFENFYSDMGDKPKGKSLDRINNEGNYTPENCRWATREVQQNNTRSNTNLIYKGVCQTVAQWGKTSKLNPGTLRARLYRGWNIERTLTVSVMKKGKA